MFLSAIAPTSLSGGSYEFQIVDSATGPGRNGSGLIVARLLVWSTIWKGVIGGRNWGCVDNSCPVYGHLAPILALR